jgi:O-antigen ligase
MVSIPYAALWLFVFSLPWQGIIRVGNVAVVGRLLGALALACALLAVVISARFRRWQLFHVAALLFVVWCGIGVFYFGMPQIPMKFWTFVQLFAVLWMIWELAPSGPRLRGLLTAYLLGSYVSALNTVLLLRTGEAMRRFAAGGMDPNDLAMTLALAVPIAWYLGITSPRTLHRWIARAYLPIGLLAVILTGSRGGMVTALVGLLIIPLTMTRLSPGRLAAAVVLLAAAGGLAVTYVPENIVARLESTGTEVEDARLGGRFKLWVAGVRAFMKQPVMGYGTSGFIPAIKPELGPRAQVAHNSFLSVLVEEGLIGLLLYCTMIVTVFLAVRRMPMLERRFGLVLLATMCTAMLPLTWEDVKAVWFTMAVLMGMAHAYDLRTGMAQQQRRPMQAPPPIRPRRGPRPQEAARKINRNPAV